MLPGDRELKEELNMKVKVQSETIFATVMYNGFTPLHQISIGLSLRHFDPSNVTLDMLSTPDYDLAIPPHQCLTISQRETVIANGVINNMKENDGIYIPIYLAYLQKDILPIFWIDHIDWLKDTCDKKNASHYLLFADEHFSQKKLLPMKLNFKKRKQNRSS